MWHPKYFLQLLQPIRGSMLCLCCKLSDVEGAIDGKPNTVVPSHEPIIKLSVSWDHILITIAISNLACLYEYMLSTVD